MTKTSKKATGAKPDLKASILVVSDNEKARLMALKVPTAKAIQANWIKQDNAYGAYTDSIKICLVNSNKGIEVLGKGLALIVNSAVDKVDFDGLTGSDLQDAQEHEKGKQLTKLNTLLNRISKELFGETGAKGISRGKEGFKLGGQYIEVVDRKFKRSPNHKTAKQVSTKGSRPVDTQASVLASALNIVGNIKKINALNARRTFLNLLFAHLGIGGVDLTKMYLVDENGDKLKKAS